MVGVSAKLKQCSASTAPDETGNAPGMSGGSGLQVDLSGVARSSAKPGFTGIR